MTQPGQQAWLEAVYDTVRTSLGEQAVRASLDPGSYTGQSSAMAREQAAAARQAVAALRANAAPPLAEAPGHRAGDAGGPGGTNQTKSPGEES